MQISRAALRDLPKIEIHVHLEGTISPATAVELARNHEVDPSSLPLIDGRYPARFTSFEHFVDVYLAISRLIRTPGDLRTVAAAFARRQAEENVVHTEVTFTAMTHVNNGMDPNEMWEAVAAGLSEAPEGTEISLIVDAVRNEGPERGHATVALVENAGAPVCGFGLSGVEGSVPEREFKMLRDAADAMGLGLAVHAGETGSADIVRAALDDLGADRIGHGIAAERDRALIERLRRDGIPLEVCPTSNVCLGVVPSLEEHPFPRLWQQEVNVTVNSDDPPFFWTTLTDELLKASRMAGLGREGVAELQRRAARAAFVSRARREQMVEAINAWEAAG
ncbi:MAG TPA: adenosine deaminase [Actinomycetota bacterium]|jgi:adenosine deaminase|nr:adenosine deaminase [Actinomycetota bacterium]